MAGISTAALLAATAVKGGIDFFGQRKAAKGAQAQGDYQGKIFDLDAGYADQQAQDALSRGKDAESASRLNTRQTIGTQRAALAASGVDVGSGSAADVQGDTATLGELDALTIKNNAQREAYGYRVQAQDYRMQGQLARMGGANTAAGLRNQSLGTLLTTGANLVDIYANRPRAPKKKP